MKTTCAILSAFLILVPTLPGPAPAEAPRRTVTDMAGRVVEFPGVVARVATVGSVPIMTSFILALGRGDSIVNGVPPFSQTKTHRYLRLLVPSVFGLPIAQGPAGDPNFKALSEAQPDLVITMDRSVADQLQQRGLPAVVIRARKPEEIKAAMTILGEVLGAGARAERYLRYFDDTSRRVGELVAPVPQGQRPRVLFLSVKNMRRPHQIDEWWISEAGGVSVIPDGQAKEDQTFSVEQVQAWNPDVLIVNTEAEIAQVYRDERLGAMRAVRTKRVHTVPVGVQTWHRTVEQPLALLWAVKTFFPERSSALDLSAETKRFYGEFFDYNLTDAQVSQILSGLQ